MKGLLALSAILYLSARCTAGSIFDSSPGSDSDSNSHSNRPAQPVRPKPAPTPDPAPQPSPDPAAPDPGTPSAGPQGDSDLADLKASASASLAAARKAIEDYRKAAEAKCMAALEGSTRYRQAVSEKELAQTNLDNARASGSTSARLQASTELNAAAARLKQMCDTALVDNDDYQEAIKFAANITVANRGKTAKADHADPDDPVTKALREHNLIEGMTLEQAERSARAKPELLDSANGMAHYRWRIMGTTGTSTRYWTDAFGHSRTTDEPTRGVVATVEAWFADGKLTEFRRLDGSTGYSGGYGGYGGGYRR